MEKEMKLFGLIGKPLTHSFSKNFFKDKFRLEKIDADYQNFQIENVELIKNIINENPDIEGFNVTIPYKETVIKHLDDVEDVAKTIGAVNVIKVVKNNGSTKLIGYNSDIYGFYSSLQPNLKEYHKNALIIGTGGASKAVSYVFDQLKIDYKYVSRNPKKGMLSYQQVTEKLLSEYNIVVNTTPVGMYPDVTFCPELPYLAVTNKHLFFDLIYNPTQTIFLKKAAAQGATTVNGLKMLYYQAEKSWEMFNLSKPEEVKHEWKK